ncbi:MAG: tetratricopeptide repeat protein [Chthoniobacterales bacterium]|nr:tetratricopeptide repeat protein [Chthoniobacterales bacterium]
MPKRIALALLCAIGFIVYLPALRAGFVWDDRALVLTDPLIRSWQLSWEGFQHFLFVDAGGSDFYRPLQRLSYLIDYAIFAFAPMGYHFVSVFWHTAAAVAFFFFAEELLRFSEMSTTRRAWLAFLAALIWLVHPVQSAAVAYIAGRADPLAAAFGFLALFLGLRMLRATRERSLGWAIGLGFCLLASALSKEMGLLFLALWLIIVFARGHCSEFWRALAIVVPVLALYLSLRVPAEHFTKPPNEHATSSLAQPILIARAAAEYAGLLIFPLHLHMDRDVQTHAAGFAESGPEAAAWRELQTLLGLAVIAGTLYAVWRARRQPAVFLPLLLGLVSYLPVSGLVRLNATVAEHWLYLPSAFLFLGAVAAADSLGIFQRRTAQICLTTWLIFLPLRAYVRNGDWKDQRTFLERTIASGGDSARMFINLGGLELSEGHLKAARRDLEAALAREPGNPLALLNLGAVAIKQRDFAQARSTLQKVTASPELEARAQESLSVLEERENGRVNLLRLRMAAHLGAPNWSIEKRYLMALADLGFPERAIAELRTCLSLAPYRAESWATMSELLQCIGRPNEAAIALAEARADDVHLRGLAVADNGHR